MTQPAADLATLVRRAGELWPGRIAVAAGDDQVTFAALAARIAATAVLLRALGMRPGDRLVVLLHRSVAEAVVLLATAAAGGIAVPVHGKLKDDQVAHIVADCAPFAVVTSELRLLGLRAGAAALGGCRVLDLAGELAPALAAPPGSDWPPHPAVDAAAILLYTSGSTGRAKGVIQDHGNLTRGAAIVADYLDLSAADHVLAVLPLAFDYGLNQLLSALHVGCRLTSADHLGVAELAGLLRRHQPTGLAGVPSLWHEIAAGLASGAMTAADGRCLRYVTNSGGVLQNADARALRRHWPHVAIYAMYGLTEAFRSAYLPPEEFDAHPDSFGRALPGVDLLLVDPDTGKVLEGPAIGELVHAGALVARGYWRHPEATAARFRPDPRGRPGTVVYSGDLVRRDAGGRLYFVGRRDGLLKVSGHRVSPDEVAAAVAGAPGVGEVAVFSLGVTADGHRIVLCASGDATDQELPAALLRRCRARLPSYMVPAVVHVLPALPHNANGKVDLGALRALLAGPDAAAPS